MKAGLLFRNIILRGKFGCLFSWVSRRCGAIWAPTVEPTSQAKGPLCSLSSAAVSTALSRPLSPVFSRLAKRDSHEVRCKEICMRQIGLHFSKISSQNSNCTSVFSLAVVLCVGFKNQVQNGPKIRIILVNSVLKTKIVTWLRCFLMFTIYLLKC